MAQITLTPNTGSPGTTITVIGTGFAANSPLTLVLNGSDARVGLIAVTFSATTTDSSGSVHGTFTIPEHDIPVGFDYTVELTDGSSNTATATLHLCWNKAGDGIDVNQNPLPWVAAGGGDILAYIHHDGAHWIAWADPSVLGVKQTIFPPPANHALNLTEITDDTGAVFNYEIDTNYFWTFTNTAGAFLTNCGCGDGCPDGEEPIWTTRFWFETWAKPLYDVKLASDGETLLVSVLTRETVPYPYLSNKDSVHCIPGQLDQFQSIDELTNNLTSFATTPSSGYTRTRASTIGTLDFCHPSGLPTSDGGDAFSGHWSPPRVVVFAVNGGTVSRIGTMDAKYCPGHTSGKPATCFLVNQASQRGTFFSGVSFAASPAQPGVFHMVWSEGGDWGEMGAAGSGVGFATPPAPVLAANAITNGDFSAGWTNWTVDPPPGWGGTPGASNDFVTPDGRQAIVDGAAQLYAGKAASTWDGGTQLTGVNTDTDHEYGLIYNGDEWIVPNGWSQWQFTFTYQRLEFTGADLAYTNNAPWGILTGTPMFPGTFDGGTPGADAATGGYGTQSVSLIVGNQNGPQPIEAVAISPAYRSPDEGGPSIGTPQTFTITITLLNSEGPVPWQFAFAGAQILNDPTDYSGINDAYEMWGFAYAISDVQVQQVTNFDASGDGSGGSSATGGAGDVWDWGAPNRDYRVGYSTWNATGKTSEVDLFRTHIDRASWFFPYDYGDGGILDPGVVNTGYSWPEPGELWATAVHAVRNDNGSPVLFIAWPNVEKNAISLSPRPPDIAGRPWLDNALVYCQPTVEMYDISSGAPVLLQSIGSDLLPTAAESAYFYDVAAGFTTSPDAPPNALNGGLFGYSGVSLDGDGVTDRAFALSLVYDDPLLGNRPVYLLAVPWRTVDDPNNAEFALRVFYRVPADGSAPFDFLDGAREVDFSILPDDPRDFAAPSFGSHDFYSDPNNIWAPLASFSTLYGIQYDRVCANRWSPYTLINPDTVDFNQQDFGPVVPQAAGVGFYHDPNADTISYGTYPDRSAESNIAVASLTIDRGANPCRCQGGIHAFLRFSRNR